MSFLSLLKAALILYAIKGKLFLNLFVEQPLNCIVKINKQQ